MASAANSMTVSAAGPASVQALIAGPLRPARVLGSFPTAVYLRLEGGDVVAVLTRDAVRLPLGLVIAARSPELPLNTLPGPVQVGESEVRIGRWIARLARLVSVDAPRGIVPDRVAVERAWRRLGPFEASDPDPAPLRDLLRGPGGPQAAADLARRMLGGGSGLTPSGDDVLAGFLVGGWSFGVALEPLRAAVLAAAPTATTDLSAALLRCASRGEAIPEVGALATVLSASGADGERAVGEEVDGALARLVEVGHTSGQALATGLVAAACVASRPAAATT
ncbi:MAG TPA: DUF2877 domain-containing protein [Nocardioidaceae bacterium]|nr:DUF2877 domain-containing protein [Nocardioidaceae bacterium]